MTEDRFSKADYRALTFSPVFYCSRAIRATNELTALAQDNVCSINIGVILHYIVVLSSVVAL